MLIGAWNNNLEKKILRRNHNKNFPDIALALSYSMVTKGIDLPSRLMIGDKYLLFRPRKKYGAVL